MSVQSADACQSCGASRLGPYCAQCGERRPAATDLSLRNLLLHELPRELTEIDGKFLTSLRYLVTRPGFLAAEYVAGRRRPYVGPIRLLLAVFVLHFLALSLWPGGALSLPDLAAQIDPTGWVARLAAAKAPLAYWRTPEVRAWVAERGHWFSEGGTVLIALVVAIAQQVMFRRPPRRYLEHAVLALNVTTFYLLVIAVAELGLGFSRARQFSGLDQTVRQIAGGTVFVVYWFLAIRRFYGASLLAAAAATAVIALLQVIVALSLNIAILVGLVIAVRV